MYNKSNWGDGVIMYIPSFLFEPEDASFFKSEGVFMGEAIHKKSGLKYFKINERKLDKLIDLVYSNSLFGDKDKSDAEFDIRTLSSIFTSIVSEDSNKDIIVNSILSYYKINPHNAKLLMTLI